MTDNVHFENLWEHAENAQQKNVSACSTNDIIEELLMKVNLYKTSDNKEWDNDQRKSIKSRLMGEILFTLTKLSIKENIDVYESLASILVNRKISSLPDS